ncbi:uncharacterized protein LOC124290519 [Haliotis rubra]|uniref:uncharacterized protein LOC124290519 n=1 Tax=Haliotis rubra TaxID=36100 RepID=UPI001EE5A9F2|nr:uncharacterized protein LOC124290519 [Haliotis rubra]
MPPKRKSALNHRLVSGRAKAARLSASRDLRGDNTPRVPLTVSTAPAPGTSRDDTETGRSLTNAANSILIQPGVLLPDVSPPSPRAPYPAHARVHSLSPNLDLQPTVQPTGYPDTLQQRFFPPNAGYQQLHVQTEHLGSHVRASIRDKIYKGEFVDLRQLLPPQKDASQEAVNFSMELDSSGQVVFRPKQQPSRPLTIGQWTSAFNTFISIYVEKHQDTNTVQHLLAYMETVRGAAARFGGDCWAQYDIQFRQRMERNPTRPWGTIDGQLWLELMLPNQRQPPQSANRPPSNNQNHNHRAYTAAPVCWDFNKQGCRRQNCNYVHKCQSCDSRGHGASSCFQHKGSRPKHGTFPAHANNNPISNTRQS